MEEPVTIQTNHRIDGWWKMWLLLKVTMSCPNNCKLQWLQFEGNYQILRFLEKVALWRSPVLAKSQVGWHWCHRCNSCLLPSPKRMAFWAFCFEKCLEKLHQHRPQTVFKQHEVACADVMENTKRMQHASPQKPGERWFRRGPVLHKDTAWPSSIQRSGHRKT